MRVWKAPVANADRKGGNVLAESLLAEIRSVPTLEALAMFEADWIAGRHRNYPHQWLVMVQGECEDRRVDLIAEARMEAMDRQYQRAMDSDRE